jgi:DNA (cytosine-5)-methyltransferase 1
MGPMTRDGFRVAGLFAGVGGVELGLQRAGHKTEHLCESWGDARAVLQRRFSKVDLTDDVNDIRSLPDSIELVAAGFPCTDLSQAGRMAGIDGQASGLVHVVLDLLDERRVPWLLIENVPHMLRLNGGRAMTVITERLEQLGYSWAYRIIDSRSFGLPQRRRRVFLLASQDEDPRLVLYRGDQGEPEAKIWKRTAYGFYWTEGNRGLGWAVDALPPLKGGTTANIPSPPAVWRPNSVIGRRIVTPSITAAEVAQGLPPGWTEDAPERARWKLVGNAVSVPVSDWIGRGLREPAEPDSVDSLDLVPLDRSAAWPAAACYVDKKRWAVQISEWPTQAPDRLHLGGLLQGYGCKPLSHRAARGFRDRLARSSLRYDARFMGDLSAHVDVSE